MGFGDAVARGVVAGVAVWLVYIAVGGLIGFGLSFFRPVSDWTREQYVRRSYATIGSACVVGFGIGLAGYGEVVATLMAAILVLWLNAPDAFSRPEGAEEA